jgi:hypothetical protein
MTIRETKRLRSLIREIESTSPKLRAELLRIFDMAEQNGIDTANEHQRDAREQQCWTECYLAPWTYEACKDTCTLASISSACDAWLRCNYAQNDVQYRAALRFYAKRGYF